MKFWIASGAGANNGARAGAGWSRYLSEGFCGFCGLCWCAGSGASGGVTLAANERENKGGAESRRREG